MAQILWVVKNVSDDKFVYEVSPTGVIKIEYHEPAGEGDAHYCDVYHSSGNMSRVFYPDIIHFEKEG